MKLLFEHNLYKDICSTLQKCGNVRVRRIHLGNFTKGNEVPLPETARIIKLIRAQIQRKSIFVANFG